MAQTRFEAWLREKPQESLNVTWEGFKESFMERFLPKSVKKARAKEFKILMYIIGIRVMKYGAYFT